MIPMLRFSSLQAIVIQRVQLFLDSRPEPEAAGVKVRSKRIGSVPTVTINQAAGPGEADTLDDSGVRVNVYHSNPERAEDLAILVRAFFDGPLADGLPIVRSRVTAGPIEIDSETNDSQWYFVADIRRRGEPLETTHNNIQ